MPPSSPTACILLSGGLDSVLSASLATQEISPKIALTFNYGQRAASHEIAAAQFFTQKWDIPHHIIDLPWLGEITKTALVNHQQSLPFIKESELDDLKLTQESAQNVWVPNRNGIFLNIAAAFAESKGCDWIITGFNNEEGTTFPDNTDEAIQTANQSFEWTTLNHVKAKSWVQEMTKEVMVKQGLTLDLPFEKLWSCYEGFEKMCGQCESCQRSIRAYKKNDVWERMKKHFCADV